MRLPTLARSAFLALLMTSAASAALAAPKHHAQPVRSNAALAAEVRDLRTQLEELKAQFAAQAKAQAQPAAQVQQADLDAVREQLADVQAKQEAANTDILSLKPAPAGVVATLSNGRPAFNTVDKRFSAQLRATVMFDAASYMQKHNLPAQITGPARDLNDGTNFRRARFGIDGKLFNDFEYSLIYEFGGSGTEDAGHIHEAWLQYDGFKPFRLRFGAFEPNVGLSAAVSTSQMPLMERPGPAEMARNVTAGDARTGIQLTGNGVLGEGDSGIAARWFVNTALTGNSVSTLNSAGGFATQPFGEQQAWLGRVAIAPFDSVNWQAHFGLNAQYVIHPNDATGGAAPRYPIQLRERPELRVDTTRLVDTGAIDARHVSVYGAEAGASIRNFLIESEYFKYKIERRNTTATILGNPRFDGWYVQGVWVLTGEPRLYNPAEARFDGPKPTYNFSPGEGAWGAVEVAARYSDLNLDWHSGVASAATPTGGIRGGEQKIWTVGANWYLNPTIRFMLDYQHVKVERLNGAGLEIGQTYNAIAARSQFAF